MACKYKIIKEDFFGGTPYCSLHDDFCINLKFVCDTNCQIYEDQKELEKIKELFNRTCKCKHLVLDECSLTGKNCIGINECLYKHQRILKEIRAVLLFHEKELDECLHNDIDGQILQKISEVLYVENN